MSTRNIQIAALIAGAVLLCALAFWFVQKNNADKANPVKAVQENAETILGKKTD